MSKLNVKIFLSSKRTQRSFWQLWASPQEYNLWLFSQSRSILCFDGASKGNPEEACARGVLYGPRGNQIPDFSQNLGNTSNNMVESYAVYQGILLAWEQQLNHITIVGVSKNIIRYFVLGNTLKDSKLNRIIDQSKLLLTTTQAQFFHILRGNNQDADRMANREIYMAHGSLSIQGWVSFVAPP